MQSSQDYQQRSEEQRQEPAQPPAEQISTNYGPTQQASAPLEEAYQPTQRATQPPEGTYQPQQAPQPPFQPMQQAAQPWPQQPYQPQQAFPQPYPGYVGAYPMGERKDWLMTLLLCVFVGWLGIHRFYTGHILIGVLQLLTFGGCGVWTLVDLILIVTDNYKDANGYPLVKK
ncbi:MAG TPA: NINE protein [Ktedonobacterales bacterium]|nr:NINE protein [Ktedonobacterales bacterium]